MANAPTAFEIRHFDDANGGDLFGSWLDQITDIKARAAIAARLVRLELGLFGDCKPIQNGVWELRVHHGAGWRVYYGRIGQRIVLLLAGSNKSSQKAGIALALKRWEEYQTREN